MLKKNTEYCRGFKKLCVKKPSVRRLFLFLTGEAVGGRSYMFLTGEAAGGRSYRFLTASREMIRPCTGQGIFLKIKLNPGNGS